MHAHLLSTPQAITTATAHCAFTSLCVWKERFFLAYRHAQTHGIAPPGTIVLSERASGNMAQEIRHTILTYPSGDLRDPRFIVTPDLLFLLCGVYVPSPHQQHMHGLSRHSHDNQIWSAYSYTRDGKTWAPLSIYLGPNHWGWSAIVERTMWWLCSYDVGTFESSHTITLWGGSPLTGFRNLGTIYDGGNIDYGYEGYCYPFATPSEPVLYQPADDMFGCCLRTEKTMLLGTWQMGKAWRWHDTGMLLHPSALLHTSDGWMLAVRELTAVTTHSWGKHDSDPAMQKREQKEIERYDTSIALYHLYGNRLEQVLTLPGGKDCGYAGLCESRTPGEYWVSYYSSEQAPSPCSDIFLAHVQITP